MMFGPSLYSTISSSQMILDISIKCSSIVRNELSYSCVHSSFSLITYVRRDFAELFEGGFEVFDDLLGEDIGVGKILGFFQAFVPEARRCRGWLFAVMSSSQFTSPLRSPTCKNAGFRPEVTIYRPSSIRPAPGRYLNAGTEGGLCSSFCSTRLGSASCGSSRCALQPMSTVTTTNKISDLNRTILSLLFADYRPSNEITREVSPTALP
jgi:hypothetical protein